MKAAATVVVVGAGAVVGKGADVDGGAEGDALVSHAPSSSPMARIAAAQR
jgi:hypothetical protein